MRTALVLICAVAVAACAKEKTGTVEGPPLTIARPDAAVIAPPVSAAPSTTPAEKSKASVRRSAVTAEFVELNSPACKPTHGSNRDVPFQACEQITIAVVAGTVEALGEKLGPGDVMVAQGSGTIPLHGGNDPKLCDNLIVLARVQPPNCDPVNADQTVIPKITKHVVRANAAPELVWAGGQMRAHLDVGADVSPNAYVGRLEGTAPVAEHTHPDSWEILCTVDAAGTFTLDGKEQRLTAHQIVQIPPGAKHSWKPDPGSKLVAVQMYAPPGPEQRFKALAADAGKHP